MSTQAVGTYKLNSFWEGGRLIFYEKASGHTTTGDVFILGHDYVQVGDTDNDVDFQWYGTGSKSFVLDLSGATATSAGLAWTITGDLAVTGAITLTGDVSLTGDLTLVTEDVSVAQGRSIYLDGQDGGEYLRSDTANEVMLNATTSLHLAVTGADEYDFDASTLALNANTITEAGDIISNNAAGPTLQDEAATTTNPTVIPNRADETTGIGWNTSELHLVVAGVDEVAVSATAVTLGTNNLTLSAGAVSVVQGKSVYLDGLNGTEYLVADEVNVATLNAATTLHLAIGGNDEYDLDATTLAMNANTITEAGDVICNDAAGPTLQNEAATTTNPTVIPNRADETTGIGWNTSELHFVVAGVDEVGLTAAALSPGANDGNALGTSSLGWSDLYLASGSVIHFNNTDVLLTHSSNTVTLSGGDLAVTAGNFVTGAPTKMTVTTKSGTSTLTAAEAGVVLVTADNVYIYLPTYVGNSGLTYFIKAMAAFSIGVYVEGTTTTQTIDGDTIKLSTAQYDTLGVITDGSAWYVIDRVGTWS